MAVSLAMLSLGMHPSRVRVCSCMGLRPSIQHVDIGKRVASQSGQQYVLSVEIIVRLKRKKRENKICDRNEGRKGDLPFKADHTENQGG